MNFPVTCHYNQYQSLPLAGDCRLLYIELIKEFHNWTQIWEYKISKHTNLSEFHVQKRIVLEIPILTHHQSWLVMLLWSSIRILTQHSTVMRGRSEVIVGLDEGRSQEWWEVRDWYFVDISVLSLPISASQTPPTSQPCKLLSSHWSYQRETAVTRRDSPISQHSRQIYWVSVIKDLIYIPHLPIGFWNIFPWWES